jgi:hypothetical protein
MVGEQVLGMQVLGILLEQLHKLLLMQGYGLSIIGVKI